ncbi:MAG: glycosyltransferase family 4 protein [Candidatus Poribacteria bacterium]|nr:glycosyltransferase family 4 protein [Candidatus Poribacteria bacterium]
MIGFPKILHQLHLFEENGVPYVADLDKARVVQLSAVMMDILKLAETQTDDAIVETLSTSYKEEDISGAFERFAEFEREGLLFNRGEDLERSLATESKWRKLLVAIPGINVDSFFDIETLSAGTNMALSHMIQHLTKYADLHFTGSRNRKITDGVYEVDIGIGDLVRLRSKIAEIYYGILTLHQEHDRWLLPLYRHPEFPPILVQNHAPRGHGGHAINSMLRHYAAMRDYDGFTAPSDYVRDFYSQYVWDPSFFNTLPNGVDSTLFKPMEKMVAKREIAAEVGDDRIEMVPTVGYLSRVQSEKGASVYLKLAELNPHLIFLIAGPNMGRYASRKLPDNLVYIGFHPRERLPLIYNAFDVYCFMSMSGEETFGLTVLEAMACGVPPVVPNFDGVPSVVGDAGLVANAENFDQDIATLVSYPCPVDFSKKINTLLNSADMWQAFSEKARERAVLFTWDKTARRIIGLFEELHQKRKLTNPNRLLNVFAPTPPIEGEVRRGEVTSPLQYRSLVLSMNTHYERCLMLDAVYPLRVEDGVALSILKNHTTREAEAILAALIPDETQARTTLKRVRSLIDGTA